MPAKLPPYLYLKRLGVQSLLALRLSVRALLVVFAWLALLPLGNIYIWRLHFWAVDVLVATLVGNFSPLRLANSTATNSSMSRLNETATATASISANASTSEPVLSPNDTITSISHHSLSPSTLLERAAFRIFASVDFERLFK